VHVHVNPIKYMWKNPHVCVCVCVCVHV
jgi:hypothetical protein